MGKKRGPYRRKLTPKQQAFVDAFNMNGGNATAAARAAGYAYPEKAGYDLTRNKTVQQALGRAPTGTPSKLNELAPAHALATSDARKRWLMEVISGEQSIRAIHPVTGEEVERRANWPQRLKAMEMLLKVNGEFISKHEHTFPEGFVVPRNKTELRARLLEAESRLAEMDEIPDAEFEEVTEPVDNPPPPT